MRLFINAILEVADINAVVDAFVDYVSEVDVDAAVDNSSDVVVDAVGHAILNFFDAFYAFVNAF